MPIRPTRPEDWERLRDVRLAALRDAPDAFASTYDATKGQPQWRWEGWATGEGSGARMTTFVQEPSAGDAFGAMATGAVFRDEPDTAHLFAMWVAPDVRGTGLARRLVDEVLTWARDQGAHRAFLRVTDGNDAARGLYEACGFTADEGDREPLREGSELTTVAMTRAL